MRDVLLLALTAAAGWADAISYAGLGRVFTANMTGNLVLLGLAIGRVPASSVERSAVALVGFAAGAVLASAMTRDAAGNGWPARVTAALGVEACALVAFAAVWWTAGPGPGPGLDALIGLSALGMGIQSAAIRRLAVAGVTTTYVTGTLTTLMAGLAALHFAGGWPRQAGVLAALLAGAIAGGAAWSRWPDVAATGPGVLLVGVTLAAALRR